MNQLNKCWVFCKFSSFLPFFFFFLSLNVNVKSLSRVRLCNPMGCRLPGSPVHGILQASILKWVNHFLLQGIFLTQGSNPTSPVSPALACRFFTS